MNETLANSPAGRVINYLRGKERVSTMDMACDLRMSRNTIYPILQTLECVKAIKGEIVYAERQAGKPPILWTLAEWVAQKVESES